MIQSLLPAERMQVSDGDLIPAGIDETFPYQGVRCTGPTRSSRDIESDAAVRASGSIHPHLLGTQQFWGIGVFDDREFKALFPVPVPGSLQVAVRVLAATQSAPMLIPPLGEIDRTADVELAGRHAE